MTLFLKACQAKELFFLSCPFCLLLLKTRDHFCAAKLSIVLLFYDSGQDIVPIIFWGLRFLCPIPGLCASEISPAHPRQKGVALVRHLATSHRFVTFFVVTASHLLGVCLCGCLRL